MTHARWLGIAGTGAALILAGYVAYAISLPVSFGGACRLLPQREWVLLRMEADTIEERCIERCIGLRQEFSLHSVARGDFAHFTLSPEVNQGYPVTSGTCVAALNSNDIQSAPLLLQHELMTAEAAWQATRCGEKEQVICQRQSEVRAAEAVLMQCRAEYARACSLHAAGLISRAALEAAESSHQQAQAEHAGAVSWLQAAKVGEKGETAAIYEAQVASLRQELAAAQVRASAAQIFTPIDGVVTTLQDDSVLVRISDTDTLYALCPVSPSRAVQLAAGDSAGVLLTTGGAARGAFIAGIDAQAACSQGRTYVWVSVAVPNPEGMIMPGITGEVRFELPPVRLWAWVHDWMSHAADRTLGI